MDFFLSTAWAATAEGGASSSNPIMSFLPLIVILVLFYFLLIRPQMRRQKDHRQLIENLSVGDEIVTAGGVLGRIAEIGDQFLTVEIADGIQVKVQRHTVATVMPRGTIKVGQ